MTHVQPSPLNSNSSTTFRFSILAIFRNEQHAIVEWIEHYLQFGAEHFFLIDNNSTDNYISALSPYIKAGIVDLYRCEKDGYQVGAYTELLPILRERTEWIGVFDLDEFVYPLRHNKICSVIQQFSDYEAILIPWLSFGSNGHLQQPASVVDGFLTRGEAGASRAFLKAISRPEAIVNFTQHNPGTRNGKKILANGVEFGSCSFIRMQENELDAFQLLNNHYRLQSLEYFTRVKTSRPEVNERVCNNTKPLSFFTENDQRWSTVVDTRLAVLHKRFSEQPYVPAGCE